MRSEQIVAAISEDGFDIDLPTFQPSVEALRYRNPAGYNEMLEIISGLEMDKILLRINNSVCYSLQIDGSLDRMQSDKKFSTIRFIEPDCSLQNVFVSVSEPVQNGAKGLLEAVKIALGRKLNRDKFVSLTTDGESANTGRDAGLWKLVEAELGHQILTIWCTCHRSDLALEDLEDSVPELKIWKSNAIGCSSYFRSSKCRTKLLSEFAEELKIETLSFPSHHEVRFAEHGGVLLKAILRNLPVCRKVWTSIIDSTDYTSKEKSKALDLLNTWACDSLQFKLTGLMYDIYHIFTSLQKGLQKSNIILPDVITLRDAAVRKLNVVICGPMPGGQEEIVLGMNKERNQTIRSHLLLTNEKSNYDEIRTKVAQLSRDFIAKRLHIETDKSIDLMKNIITATTCESLIEHSVKALKIFINDEQRDKISILTNDICEQWPILENIPTLETSDIGCQYSVRLRQMFAKSTGLFQWLLGAFAVSSPHSMNTERVVSHHNLIKSIHRENQELESVSHRLNISLNSLGTAYFDPRPAVVAFLEKKDRRFRPADWEIYQTHDFTHKFFRKETKV